MKKAIVFFMIILPLLSIAQSNYYDKGVYWAKGATNNPYWQEKAYNEWKTGEQKGEVESARAVIGCYFKGFGTPKNASKAVNLINKWYKKDQKICMLGALINIPRKYSFIPYKLSFDGLIDFENISLDDLGMSADISKALFYAKYAKENHHSSLIFSAPQSDLYYIIEGLCYKNGVGGYKKDLIQAAKRLNFVIDRYGNHDYSPMFELINQSLSPQELYSNMVETAIDINNGVSHDMETLLRLAASEGPSKPVRNGYINDFLFKVDKFVDEFWSLPLDKRISLYNNSDEHIKRIYDNSLLYKVSALQKKDDLNPADIDTMANYLKDYPSPQAVNEVQSKLEKYVLDAMEQYADNYDRESYAMAANTLNALINGGIITTKPTERLKNIQNILLGKFRNQRTNLTTIWSSYEKSRKADLDMLSYNESQSHFSYVFEGDVSFYERSRKLLLDIRLIKKSCANDETSWLDEIERFADQSFSFAQALGFYTDEDGRDRKRDTDRNDLKRFLDENPDSIYQWYAITLAKQLGIEIKDLPSAQMEIEENNISENTSFDSNQERHGLFLANYAFSPIYQHSFGLTFGSVKKFGWYINVMTNGCFDFSVDQTATLDDNGVNTEYLWSGEVTKSRFSASVGGLYAINQLGYVYAGVGYGIRNRLWLTMSDQVVAITPGTYKGLAFEAGLMLNLGEHILISGGVLTQSFGPYYEMKLGIGYKF